MICAMKSHCWANAALQPVCNFPSVPKLLNSCEGELNMSVAALSSPISSMSILKIRSSALPQAANRASCVKYLRHQSRFGKKHEAFLCHASFWARTFTYLNFLPTWPERASNIRVKCPAHGLMRIPKSSRYVSRMEPWTGMPPKHWIFPYIPDGLRHSSYKEIIAQ